MQLLYFLGVGSAALASARKRRAALTGVAKRAVYLAHGAAQHAARLELTPYVVYVQKLARLMRAAVTTPTRALVQFYLAAEHAEGALDAPTLDALLQHFVAAGRMKLKGTYTPCYRLSERGAAA